MKIGGRYDIGHPAQRVFETLRDKQAELVAFLPNVESVQQLERAEDPPVVRLHTKWQGNSDEVAAAIRPFINREMMSWFDEASWNGETLVCEWRLRGAKASELFSCTGTTRIVEGQDGGCVFDMTGDMTVHPDKIPGVPKFVAKRIREPIEKFVGNLLAPNLGKMAQAVQQYLDKA